jgi:hypothetical protein
MAAAMLEDGAARQRCLSTAEMDTTNSGDTKPQGYVTNYGGEEILEQATKNPKTPGWFQPVARQG